MKIKYLRILWLFILLFTIIYLIKINIIFVEEGEAESSLETSNIISYKYIEEGGRSFSGHSDVSTNNINLKYIITKEEYDLLTRLVYCEGNTESIECQMNIIQVVFNRVEDECFPNTIYDVVHAYNQFQPVGTGAIKDAKPNKINKQALDSVLNGECDLPAEVVFFWSTSIDVYTKGTWFYNMHKNNYYITIDRTRFYYK